MVFCVIEWVLRRCWVSGLLRKHVDSNKGENNNLEARRQEGTGWINMIWVSSNSNQTEATDEKRGRGEIWAGPTGREVRDGERGLGRWKEKRREGNFDRADRSWNKSLVQEAERRGQKVMQRDENGESSKEKSYKLWGGWKGWRWMEYSGPKKVIKVLDPESDV